MPKKIRELKKMLRQAGFTSISAKGSHTKWTHPKLSQKIIISGKDSDDAKRYLEKQVDQSLKMIQKLEQQEDKNDEL